MTEVDVVVPAAVTLDSPTDLQRVSAVPPLMDTAGVELMRRA